MERSTMLVQLSTPAIDYKQMCEQSVPCGLISTWESPAPTPRSTTPLQNWPSSSGASDYLYLLLLLVVLGSMLTGHSRRH